MDRIDIFIEVPRVTYNDLTMKDIPEASSEIKKRVEAARQIQRERLKHTGKQSNSSMSSKMLRKYCCISTEAAALFKSVFSRLRLSARSHDRILKVARTVADLSNSEIIEAEHLAEAVQYRGGG